MIKSLLNSKTGTIGAIILALVLLMAILAGILAPHDPLEQDILHKLLNPVWTYKSNPNYILGTDQLGRDILSRLIYGSRVTILVAFAGTVAAGFIGVILGCLSGYYGGWVDNVIMRIADIQMAFPFILLALFIAAVLGPGIGNVILVACLCFWVQFARMVRGEILSIREVEYVEAIRALGGSNLRIIFKHILPNVMNMVIVIGTLQMARVILMEASLSFLGLGVPVDVPTWGRMLAESRINMVSYPWHAIFPGLLITVTVLGVNLLGDWLRDYLDPNLDV
jgi:peptide/nickel transport system permease protein